MYEVIVKKKILKIIKKMPENIQKIMVNLVEDLRSNGPIRSEWPNFSKLGKDHYHCHLSNKCVACWSGKKNSIIIEVTYAGSRENAPS